MFCQTEEILSFSRRGIDFQQEKRSERKGMREKKVEDDEGKECDTSIGNKSLQGRLNSGEEEGEEEEGEE